MIATTTNSQQPPRVRVVITGDDGEPRIYYASAYQDSTPEEIRQAVTAGAQWFDVAFGESLRRAHAVRAAAAVEQAEVERAA